ncbi:UNVERIFIED_CONTAM: hypothetical protein RF653_03250 [Kocuria sp. CPCC 205316]|uniref:hypothetical protein n=1 Tax=Kocuria TaxID=57493 RepID=UPI0036DACEF5
MNRHDHALRRGAGWDPARDPGRWQAVRTDLTRRLAVGMLECFPLIGDRELRSLSTAAQARRYRIAVAFLDDNAQLPVTVEDAARAASAMTTALVRVFRAHHPWAALPASTCAGSARPRPTPTGGRGPHHRGHRDRDRRPVGFSPPGPLRACPDAYGVTPRRTLET